ERRWLRQLESHLARHREDVQELWATLSTGTVIPIRSLTFRRVDTVRYLEHSGVQVDAGTLSEITVSKEEALRANAVPNYLVSVFLIVGLGGTFLALRQLLHNSPLRNVTSSGQID